MGFFLPKYLIQKINMTFIEEVKEAQELVAKKAKMRREKLLELYEQGYTAEDLARLEGVHRSKIFRLLQIARKEKQNEISQS